MFNDPKKEEQYIIKQLELRDKQFENKDFKLNEGDIVRYLLPRTKLDKKRFRYSPEAYTISGRDGNNYILMAKDGTTITKPRFQLIKDNKVKLADTIEGKWKGVIKEIIGEVGKDKVRVKFEVPGQKDYEDIIPKSFLRSRLNKTEL